VAVAVLGAMVVAAGALAVADRAGPTPSPSATAPSAVRRPPTSGGIARRTAGPAGFAVILPRPRVVDCTTVSSADCADAILAARRVVGPSGDIPDRATVHPGLRCAVSADCPTELLARSRALGSVDIVFRDGRSTWVNVVRHRATDRGPAVPEAVVVVPGR
jgi:hypothetical protein